MKLFKERTQQQACIQELHDQTNRLQQQLLEAEQSLEQQRQKSEQELIQRDADVRALRSVMERQLAQLSDQRQALEDCQERLITSQDFAESLLRSKTVVQEECIVLLKDLRARDEKLQRLAADLADAEFEADQLKVAFRCTAAWSWQLEVRKQQLEQHLAALLDKLEGTATAPAAPAAAATLATAPLPRATGTGTSTSSSSPFLEPARTAVSDHPQTQYLGTPERELAPDHSARPQVASSGMRQGVWLDPEYLCNLRKLLEDTSACDPSLAPTPSVSGISGGLTPSMLQVLGLSGINPSSSMTVVPPRSPQPAGTPASSRPHLSSLGLALGLGMASQSLADMAFMPPTPQNSTPGQYLTRHMDSSSGTRNASTGTRDGSSGTRPTGSRPRPGHRCSSDSTSTAHTPASLPPGVPPYREWPTLPADNTCSSSSGRGSGCSSQSLGMSLGPEASDVSENTSRRGGLNPATTPRGQHGASETASDLGRSSTGSRYIAGAASGSAAAAQHISDLEAEVSCLQQQLQELRKETELLKFKQLSDEPKLQSSPSKTYDPYAHYFLARTPGAQLSSSSLEQHGCSQGGMEGEAARGEVERALPLALQFSALPTQVAAASSLGLNPEAVRAVVERAESGRTHAMLTLRSASSANSSASGGVTAANNTSTSTPAAAAAAATPIAGTTTTTTTTSSFTSSSTAGAPVTPASRSAGQSALWELEQLIAKTSSAASMGRTSSSSSINSLSGGINSSHDVSATNPAKAGAMNRVSTTNSSSSTNNKAPSFLSTSITRRDVFGLFHCDDVLGPSQGTCVTDGATVEVDEGSEGMGAIRPQASELSFSRLARKVS